MSSTVESLLPVDIRDLDGIQSCFNENGVVIVRLLTEEQCDALILEQWQRVILQQPWKEGIKIQIRDEHGRTLDPELHTDQPAFLRQVKSALDKTVLEKLKNGWPLHRGFGACCDPVVFHGLPKVWELRQDSRLYQVACKIIGTKDLWVDINRSIQKLPGEGESEFLHWDLSPFDVANAEEDKPPTSMCGKVVFLFLVIAAHAPRLGTSYSLMTYHYLLLREQSDVCLEEVVHLSD